LNVAKLSKSEIAQADRLSDELRTPDGYARHRLGFKLHPKQAAVLRDLFPVSGKSRVSFRKANEVGGTRTVITAAILYALDILDAEVISTAGKWSQVATQLIPSLKLYESKFPRWQFLDTCIKINGVERYIPFSTTSGFAQGYHKTQDRPLVGIIDEAGLVEPGIFADIEDRCNPNYCLFAGAPMEPAGAFYDIETKLARFYRHHHLSQMDCLTTAGYWIDQRDIDRKIAKYGKEHPFIQSNIFGEFAAQIENGLMSLKDFNQCLASAPEWMPGHNDRHAFVDVGRTNCFAVRHGNKVWIEKEFYEPSESNVAGWIIRIASKLKRDIGLMTDEVTVDGGGEFGKIVCDTLHDMGWPVNKWYGQSDAVDPDYENAISEAWLAGAKLMKDCDIIVPNNDNFRHQVLTRKTKAHPSGRSQIEPKDEYIKRGFDSPHEADAIFGAMTRRAKQQSTNLAGQSRQEDTRGWVERGREERGENVVIASEGCL